MKQSLQAHLTTVEIYHSLDMMLDAMSVDKILVAHEKVDEAEGDIDYKSVRDSDKTLLLVGPEGGFSQTEISNLTDKGAQLVSLGPHRLRAETAAIAFMSQFL
jgi:16S rRNA (uracil1498-N3)-methyltransferase